jgi:hypothetical protein
VSKLDSRRSCADELTAMDDASEQVPVRPDLDEYLAALRAAEAAKSRSRNPFARGAAGAIADDGLWGRTLQWCVAAALALLLAFLTYTRAGWVPLLSYFDLGVHEFGHMIFFWAPTLWVQFAGSFLQVAAPLGLGAYFLWRRDRFAVVLMAAWAAESLNNVSVYVGDAQRMDLTLFGDDGSGSGHDWHNIFTRLNLLPHTDAISHFVRGMSVAMFVVALGLALWWYLQSRRRAPQE